MANCQIDLSAVVCEVLIPSRPVPNSDSRLILFNSPCTRPVIRNLSELRIRNLVAEEKLIADARANERNERQPSRLWASIAARKRVAVSSKRGRPTSTL